MLGDDRRFVHRLVFHCNQGVVRWQWVTWHSYWLTRPDSLLCVLLGEIGALWLSRACWSVVTSRSRINGKTRSYASSTAQSRLQTCPVLRRICPLSRFIAQCGQKLCSRVRICCAFSLRKQVKHT